MRLAKLRGEPEIFLSVQGEGKSMGMPSVFVRTSHCNLYCVWCDTDYTWNWEGTPFAHVRDAVPGYRKFRREEQVVELPVQDVAERVLAHGCDRVVLTGGEPLSQQSELVELIDLVRAVRPSMCFEVETNATFEPSVDFDTRIDQYNASPKLASSGVKQRHRHVEPVLRVLAASPKATFKLVVASAEDLAEALSLVKDYELDRRRVWLMPEGSRSEVLRERQRWLALICLEHGLNLGDRLHVHLYGDERGR